MKLISFIMILILATASFAGREARAADGTILRVEGKTADGTAHDFTRADLEALGLTTIRTKTPWHDGVQTFEGVPLDAVMRAVASRGDRLIVAAINRYQSEIPIEDVQTFGVILAMKRNGATMEISDKGPLFVIYPFDQHPELRKELYYGRSVWQVRSITIQ